MRLIFTIFSILLLSQFAKAQDLTGIWRGYFSSSSNLYPGAKEEMYKYEVQIAQKPNNGISGVTYSYKSTEFYGKATMQGIYSVQSKSLIIKENKLVEMKIAGDGQACVMTCYLDYSKMGKMEFLQGTFISVNSSDKTDCGSGKIYLEKVTKSDFKKEDFLLKKNGLDTVFKKNDIAAVPKPKTVIPNLPKKTDTVKQKTKQAPVITQKPAVKQIPKTNTTEANPTVKNNKPNPIQQQIERIPEASVNSPKMDTGAIIQKNQIPIQKVPLPKVLMDRENNLVATIVVDQEDIQIDFFDNGTIDNDTISVYHNNKMVVSNGRLSYSPIRVNIKCSKTDSHHEIIVVAENLGDIPPNTALMVITANGGRFRKEVFLASTEDRNAKVIIEYKKAINN